MHIAAIIDNTTAMYFLLTWKADIDANDAVMDGAKSTNTPLHYAALNGHLMH